MENTTTRPPIIPLNTLHSTTRMNSSPHVELLSSPSSSFAIPLCLRSRCGTAEKVGNAKRADDQRTVAHKRRSIYLAAIGSSEWARSSISQRYHRAFLTIRHATLTISFLVPLLRVAFFHAALTVAPNLVNPQSRRPRDTPEIRWERRDTVAINQR